MELQIRAIRDKVAMLQTSRPRTVFKKKLEKRSALYGLHAINQRFPQPPTGSKDFLITKSISMTATDAKQWVICVCSFWLVAFTGCMN